jgi:phosphoglycerate dehydrogenase-like enzyme
MKMAGITRSVGDGMDQHVGAASNGTAPFRLAFMVPLTAAQQRRVRERFPGVDLMFLADEEREPTLATADGVVAWSLSSAEIDAAPHLRWMHTGGAGVDARLLADLSRRDIVVSNNSGVHAPNIGEHVLGMMLVFARQLHTLVRHQTRREWHDDDIRDKVFELSGQQLLVVGTGDIGEAVAQRARPFGMVITGIRRRTNLAPPDGFDDVLALDDLPRALRVADHVVICLPLTTRTHRLFDASLISQCQHGAILYNIGRGEIVDTPALITALQTGKLAGAGLDVVDPEPLPAGSPLWDMPNVLITSHTSGGTPKYWDRGLDLVEANLQALLDGTALRNVVDPSQGY